MPPETQTAVESAAGETPETVLEHPADQTVTVKDGKTVAPEAPEEKFFKKAYVDTLRNTVDKAQKEAKELRTQLDTIKTAEATATGQFKDLYETEKTKRLEVETARLADVAESNARYIRSEVRAKAAEAGIQDVSDVALIDFTKFKISDDGEVEGAAEAVEALKKSKPYLFKGTRAAAIVDAAGKIIAPVESSGNPTPKNARDMDANEFKKAWASAGGPKS